jgi:DMSO/TMAO reductase YedYZ molybdopterin-dependent catalytic subunit
MNVISRGFGGRRPANSDPRIPPGQYRTDDFPVLTAGPTPRVDTAQWALDIMTVDGGRHTLSWQQLRELPDEEITVDIHCVTKWSKLGTRWRGVSVSTLLEGANAEVGDAQYALVRSYGDYTTNLPLEDLLDGKAWIVFEFEGRALAPAHGGPARLLVPHLYLWKSAKWINGLELRRHDQLGFWEGLGYHAYGDPWREQRYVGD